MLGIIKLRGFLAPGGHVAWAAIEGAALMFGKGFDRLDKKHLNDKRFLLICLIPIVLHGYAYQLAVLRRTDHNDGSCLVSNNLLYKLRSKAGGRG